MNRHRISSACGTEWINTPRPMIDHRSVDYSPRYRKMTAARRREIFGPIQSLADEAREAGEPSFWTGLAVVLSFAAVVLAVAVMS